VRLVTALDTGRRALSSAKTAPRVTFPGQGAHRNGRSVLVANTRCRRRACRAGARQFIPTPIRQASKSPMTRWTPSTSFATNSTATGTTLSDRNPPFAAILPEQALKRNGRRRRRQLNVLSARSSRKILRVKAYSSDGSSPSASRSGVPARICSAIRPEFWRIEVSILAVMSGLAFRKALAFSRPWPSRWLS